MGKEGNIFSRLIDAVTEKVGRAIGLIALPIMLIIAIEVVSRYVFNSPTRWGWQVTTHLFGVLALFGGAYALLHGRHIRVEIFYEHFGSKLKLVSNLLTAIFFLVFIGLLVWQGYLMAEISVRSREVIRGIIHFPVYPLKILIPVAAFLFLLQGIANLLRGKI
jgi:TRAP-type mannitol/chloroaromatic compound transport system permease small subunit